MVGERDQVSAEEKQTDVSSEQERVVKRLVSVIGPYLQA